MRHVFAARLLIGILGAAVVLSGCDIFTGANDELAGQIRQRVQDRQQQWQNQNIEDYQLIYSQQVGDVLVDSIEVFVRSRTVDSIATSRDIPEEEVLVGTVASFFDLIEARIGEDESQFTADFDEDQGFPTRYTADFQDGRQSQTVLTTALVDSVKSTE
jgi:hypothetical protein